MDEDEVMKKINMVQTLLIYLRMRMQVIMTLLIQALL